MNRGLILLAVVFLVLSTGIANSAEIIPGPFKAQVIKVYDGDTITVDVRIWPGLTVRASVRVAGVDTPEIRGKCQSEKDLAIEAREFVKSVTGESVQIINIRRGKYAGRVVADVITDSGGLSGLLIAMKLGVPYQGGKRQGWCQ